MFRVMIKIKKTMTKLMKTFDKIIICFVSDKMVVTHTTKFTSTK